MDLLLIAFYISKTGLWQDGYKSAAIIMFVISAILLCSQPLWGRVAKMNSGTVTEVHKNVNNKDTIRIPGVKSMLIVGLLLGALGPSISLWTGSYLVEHKMLGIAEAAGLLSLDFVGEMAGRIVCGMLTIKFEIRQIMRYTFMVCALGVVLILLPLPKILLSSACF